MTSGVLINWLYWGTPRSPPSSVICWEEPQDSHRVELRAMSYYSKSIQSKTSEEKRHMEQMCKKPGASFQGSSLNRVTDDTLNCSNIEFWQYVWNVVYLRSSLALSSQGFYWKLVLWATLCLAHIGFQTLWRKASVLHKPYHLHRQHRHSESSYQLVNGENPLEIQLPRH